jgi:hypothetical protein
MCVSLVRALRALNSAEIEHFYGFSLYEHVYNPNELPR